MFIQRDKVIIFSLLVIFLSFWSHGFLTTPQPSRCFSLYILWRHKLPLIHKYSPLRIMAASFTMSSTTSSSSTPHSGHKSYIYLLLPFLTHDVCTLSTSSDVSVKFPAKKRKHYGQQQIQCCFIISYIGEIMKNESTWLLLHESPVLGSYLWNHNSLLQAFLGNFSQTFWIIPS